MAFVLLPSDTPAAVERFPESSPEHGLVIRARAQCVEWPSSFVLVANRIDARKTTTITGTTKNGEVMLIARAPYF
jgi:hypothetical protein